MYDNPGFLKALTTLGCDFTSNFDLSTFTSFKVGGPADYFAKPSNAEEAASLLRLAQRYEIPFLVLGNASNVLFDDEGYRGLIINTSAMNSVELGADNEIVCSSGIKLSALCNFALKNSLSGLEFAYGIPGSAGGAAYMNAGAYGGEMKDVLISCDHIDNNGVFGSYGGDELDLSYRNSVYKKGSYIITNLHFKLYKGEYEEIKAKMDELMQRRVDKQPLDYPSAGSVFKRPPDDFAGRLIEEAGLKGYRIG
ncbi:MAG TPA: UDP-N-acetylmuramate dehydrogenase, partial [Clostridiales bacterium]|nr:UDP-N-acetylmuramate dehydrogenase [Clostridiales bacterium]